MQPTLRHPNRAHAQRISRTVVLYDNAGEDFLPRTEEASSAAVRHLAKSQIIFLLFDPTQEQRFRALLTSDDPQLSVGLRPDVEGGPVRYRQETIVRELSVRLRRYLHLTQGDRLRKPLIIIVPKFDIWADMAGFSIAEEPFVKLDGGGPLRFDVDRVEQVSDALEALFRRLCPDFVATAEALSSIIRYVPVTSLGCSPVLVEREGHKLFGVYPKDLRPRWVTVPLLYSLCTWTKGTIGRGRRTPASDSPHDS
jgi:hypothetical protein